MHIATKSKAKELQLIRDWFSWDKPHHECEWSGVVLVQRNLTYGAKSLKNEDTMVIDFMHFLLPTLRCVQVRVSKLIRTRRRNQSRLLSVPLRYFKPPHPQWRSSKRWALPASHARRRNVPARNAHACLKEEAPAHWLTPLPAARSSRRANKAPLGAMTARW